MARLGKVGSQWGGLWNDITDLKNILPLYIRDKRVPGTGGRHGWSWRIEMTAHYHTFSLTTMGGAQQTKTPEALPGWKHDFFSIYIYWILYRIPVDDEAILWMMDSCLHIYIAEGQER